jgi:pimeloyl-ACP methyl ester carboxylesterase
MESVRFQLPHSHLEICGYASRPGAEQTVLCLHGWLDNSASFLPLAEALEDINLIAIDLPGHGHSAFLPEGATYDFYLYLMWLHELVEVLAMPDLILLGHSMGAAISSLYAGSFSDRLKGLVLIEGLGPLSSPEADAPKNMRFYLESWSRQALLANTLYPSWEAAVAARAKSGPIPLGSAELLAQRGAKPVPGGVKWVHDPRNKLPPRYAFSEGQILAFLRGISCPTLFVEGTNTGYAQHVLAADRLAAVPDLQRISLEGGHHVHMEEAPLLATHLRLFMSQMASRR